MVFHVFYVNLLEGITFFSHVLLCSTMFFYVLVCFTMFPSSIKVSILRVSFAAPVSTCFGQAGGCSSVTFSRLPETTTMTGDGCYIPSIKIVVMTSGWFMALGLPHKTSIYIYIKTHIHEYIHMYTYIYSYGTQQINVKNQNLSTSIALKGLNLAN